MTSCLSASPEVAKRVDYIECALLAAGCKAVQGCIFLRTSFRRSSIMSLVYVGAGGVYD